jgi:hypothetical protein
MFERPTSIADGRGVGRVVLALLAAHAIRRHQLGRHQLDGVAEGLELARPVVRARACLNADGARRQRSDQRVELAARHLGLAQLHLARLVHAVYGKHALGGIDSNGQNGHDFPFRVS